MFFVRDVLPENKKTHKKELVMVCQEQLKDMVVDKKDPREIELPEIVPRGVSDSS